MTNEHCFITYLAAEGAVGAADFQVLAATALGVGFAEADGKAGVEEAPGFAVFFEEGAGLAAVLGVEIGGFDLDAEESAVEFDDGVVAIAVSPGEADGKAEMGGPGKEGGFGSFSAALAGGLGYGRGW